MYTWLLSNKGEPVLVDNDIAEKIEGKKLYVCTYFGEFAFTNFRMEEKGN